MLGCVLHPGVTVYAPLGVRTSAGSEEGTATTEGAVLVDGDEGLFGALRYEVAEAPSCDAAGMAAATPLAAGGLDDGTPAGAISLGADGSDAADLCFAVTLPADADQPELQGRTATARWTISATSDG